MGVTVTYTHPVAGATAPTAFEAKNLVIATVIASADNDTTATVTHNFALTAAQLAAGLPKAIITPILSQAITALSTWVVSAVATNTITLTKVANTGSGNALPQLIAYIKRPHTLFQ